MNKELLLAVTDRLNSEVPALRWVDAEEGQLSRGEQRPAVAFPCALVDIAYTECMTLPGGSQRIKAQITCKVAFSSAGSTHAAAPRKVREQALAYMDILHEVHVALQWWTGGGRFNPMCRVRCTPEKRSDGLKVYNVVYRTEFQD
jgi:hypothetical protein